MVRWVENWQNNYRCFAYRCHWRDGVMKREAYGTQCLSTVRAWFIGDLHVCLCKCIHWGVWVGASLKQQCFHSCPREGALHLGEAHHSSKQIKPTPISTVIHIRPLYNIYSSPWKSFCSIHRQSESTNTKIWEYIVAVIVYQSMWNAAQMLIVQGRCRSLLPRSTILWAQSWGGRDARPGTWSPASSYSPHRLHQNLFLPPSHRACIPPPWPSSTTQMI
jgi:hypothetical protein